jgi:hypothetical protein
MEKLTAVNFSWPTAALSCVCPKAPRQTAKVDRGQLSQIEPNRPFRQVYFFLLCWKPNRRRVAPSAGRAG